MTTDTQRQSRRAGAKLTAHHLAGENRKRNTVQHSTAQYKYMWHAPEPLGCLSLSLGLGLGLGLALGL